MRASLIVPLVSVSDMAMASIITVGILFMMEDIMAAIKPIDIVATKRPCWALFSMIKANKSVSPAFLKPNTTTYIPIEKKTIAHGAPLMTALVSTCLFFKVMSKKIPAIVKAMKDTGM